MYTCEFCFSPFALIPPLLLLSFCLSLLFRFFCQHSANIPEVRGDALHNGQDPSTWGSPSTALHRLGVNFFQVTVTLAAFVQHES